MEDLYHSDVQCPPAKQLILEGGAYNHRFTGCKLPDPHPASWTCDLLSAKVCSQADAALIISGTWSLWNGRNYRKHALRIRHVCRVCQMHMAKAHMHTVCCVSGSEPFTNKRPFQICKPPSSKSNLIFVNMMRPL